MTANELFERLAPLMDPTIREHFGRHDACIFTTRVVIEVARYFGIAVTPLPVRAVIYNAPFAAHVEKRFLDVDIKQWSPVDGSYSVGIGYGTRPGARPGWNGHLIARANGTFGDFSIRQAERLDHGIITGTAIVGPYADADIWRAENDEGTTVEYERIADTAYLKAPDWRAGGRARSIIGRLIREVKT
jgi:hypothetical protein